MFKRFASMILALIMVIGVFPVSAMAEGQQIAVTEQILHEQIKINNHNLGINIGTSTEGILVINVPDSITDEDFENAYIGAPLNCTFADYSVYAPAPIENESNIKFVEFFGRDVADMENISIDDSEWIEYEKDNYMPGGMVTLATKDEEGNIVREAEGETMFDYGIVWSVGENIYYQKLRIVREMPVTPGEFEGKTYAIGSNLEFFEIVYSGSNVIYRYKGNKTTKEEVAQELGAEENSSKGIITALRIPEGYNDVAEFIQNGSNSVDEWKEFAAEFTDIEGYIPLWPAGYTQGMDLVESKRTFTIVWADENGGTFEETITVAIDFGDIVPDENNDGDGGNDEEEIPGGPRPFVERARLVLGDCEEFFQKGRNNMEIVYTYNVEEDDTREKVLERLLDNNGNSGFDIRLDSPDADVYTTIESVYIWDTDITSDFIQEPGERVTSLNLGRIWFTTMVNNLCDGWNGEYTVVWSNGKTGNEQMTYTESGIKFSIKFPVLENYPWMSTYNNPLDSERIEVVNSEGTKITAGGEAVDGLSVKGYENGKLSLKYEKPEDGSEETFSVSVKAPDGAAYYRVLTGKEMVNYNPDKEGEYDAGLDWDVESVPLGENGKFDIEIELKNSGKNVKFIDGINVWYSTDSGETEKQVAVIKWYGEGGTMDDDLYLNEYFYIDIECGEEKNLTHGVDKVTEKVTAPVIEGGSKSSVVYTKYEQNIYPANTEISGKYYFAIETDGTLETGEKVYIPYSFISEGMNEEKAANLNISIRNLFGADANTSGIEYDEFGMFFYTDALGEFVLSWNKKVPEDEDRRFSKDFYEYWKDGEIVTIDQLYIDAHPAIADYMSFEFVDEVLVVTVENIPVENWKEVYYSLEPGELTINAFIKITPPYNDIVSVHCENGNGSAYQMLKNKLYNNIEVDFGQLEYAQGFEDVAQIEVEEDEITIIPRDSGIFFASIAWKNSDGEIITQILPYEFKRAEDAESVSFPNEKTIVSENRIRTDERTQGENPIIVAEYDEKNGVLKYNYNGPRYPDDPDEDMIIGESIAINENGEENWSIDTIIEAPNGYERADGTGNMYLFPVSFENAAGPLMGSSNSFEAKWINIETGEIIVETITIQFDPGKVWMEKYWDGITEEDIDRVVFIPINDPEGEIRFETVESLKECGINIDLFSKPGRVSSTFGDVDKIDIQTVANLEIMILPPDATPKKDDESTEEWVNRVLNETEYKFNKEGATGVDWYDNYYADFANISMPSHPFQNTDIRSFRENIAQFEYIDVNGIRVWFTFSDGGNGHTVYVDWYKADENGDPEAEPSVREFVYGQWEQLVFEVEAESITESELIESGEVETPTPVVDENETKWVLTTNHFPQTKENENVSAYYFQLEGDENTPDGDKVIYLPYSFIEEGLDYEKALAMKIEPKIHHYNEDHKTLVEGAPIDGELTPYGIRFVVKSFSPFVLEWEIEEQVIHEFGETIYEWSEDGKSCTAKRVCANCEEHSETAEAEVTSEKETDATCTEKGKTKYTAVFEEAWAEPQTKTVDDIGVLGHKWDEWTVVKEPTYTSDGVEKRICENDATHVETKAVAKLVPDTTEKVEGPDSSKEYVVAYLEDTVIVPEGLEEKYPTQEDVKKALAEEAKLEGQIIFREVTVGYYDEDGNFVPVENEEFFKDGKTIDIVLAYPEGATKEDDFEILHLKEDGTIEKCTIKAKTDKGIVVEVNSLSPFAIIFEKYVEEEKDSWLDWFGWLGKLDRPSKNDKPNPGVTIITPSEKEEETNPNTGAPIFDMTLAGTIVLAASAMFIGKKR